MMKEMRMDEMMAVNGGEVRTQENTAVNINVPVVGALITAAVCSNPVGAAVFAFGAFYGAFYKK